VKLPKLNNSLIENCRCPKIKIKIFITQNNIIVFHGIKAKAYVVCMCMSACEYVCVCEWTYVYSVLLYTAKTYYVTQNRSCKMWRQRSSERDVLWMKFLVCRPRGMRISLHSVCNYTGRGLYFRGDGIAEMKGVAIDVAPTNPRQRINSHWVPKNTLRYKTQSYINHNTMTYLNASMKWRSN